MLYKIKATSRLSSQTASNESRLPDRSLYEIIFPRQGQQSPVEVISYLGYSPPKCTCMAKQTHSSNYMNLLECLDDLSHVSSPHRLPHICLSRMRVKISSFPNKSFLFLKTHYQISVKILDYPPSRIGWRPSRNSHGPHLK